jgi:iron complex outermembrane receptor protein
MSESVNTRRSGSRLHLLTSVSSIALLASVLGAGSASAGDQPMLWIELGAQSEQVLGTNELALPFDGAIPAAGLTGPLTGALNLTASNGGDGKLTFRPGAADWVFAASVSYGRSHGKGKISQTHPLPTTAFATFHTTILTYPRPYHRTNLKPAKVIESSITGDTVSSETHSILDFSAGKDVGLGMFGQGSTSVFGIGARFASFTSKLDVSGVGGVLDAHLKEVHHTFPTYAFFPSSTLIVPWYHVYASQIWHTVSGSAKLSHEFKGVGPSVYWDASVPLSGDDKRSGVVSFDWGINAALLFGKQKTKEQHQSASAYNCYGAVCNAQHVQYAPQSGHASKTRNITVPNLGGFIGASYRIGGVKASIGYRGDWFFGAFDTGLATSQKIDRGYFGPFINIGIGIGN